MLQHRRPAQARAPCRSEADEGRPTSLSLHDNRGRHASLLRRGDGRRVIAGNHQSGSPRTLLAFARYAAHSSGWTCSRRTVAGSKAESRSRCRTSRALVKLAGKRLKGAVIWDPAVPASVNVATTIAGVQTPLCSVRSLPTAISPVAAAGSQRPARPVHRRGNRQQEERRLPLGDPRVSGQGRLLLAPALPLRRFLSDPRAG